MPLRTAVALFFILVTSPALAQTPPPETSAPAKEEKPPGIVGYDKGFTLTTADDEFELKIVGRLQARWELFHTDDGVADPVITHRFQVARARVTLEGHAFKDVDYKMQTEFGKGFVFLRDFYLDKPLSGKIRIRAGQWKKPYSRHQITSSGNLQLVDRSITDKFSAAGRDIGVAIHNNYEKSPEGLEWAIGVFNGTGDASKIACAYDPMTMEVTCVNPTNIPSDIGPTVVARVGFNKGKIKGYSESDLEGGPLRFAAGVSYMGDLAEGESDAMTHRVGADFILKASGASLAGGAYLFAFKDAAGDSQTDFGFHGQGGYFLTPKKMEIAARFGMIPAGDENQLEIVGGFNWFAHGHSLKWQTDAGVLKVTGADGMQLVARTQAQIIF